MGADRVIFVSTEGKSQAGDIDKSAWGPGPWQDEPDRWEGDAEGFPALAIRNARSGNWCGYVAVPPGHPWHGKNSGYGGGDVSADVHGGLTYSGACHGKICHVPKPGEPDDVWWLGFDCHHAWDIAPGDDPKWLALGSHDSTYRTLDYVQGECRKLARAASEAVSP